jgi:hypothetical protein
VVTVEEEEEEAEVLLEKRRCYRLAGPGEKTSREVAVGVGA